MGTFVSHGETSLLWNQFRGFLYNFIFKGDLIIKMGIKQSKRSVDITSTPKKGGDAAVIAKDEKAPLAKVEEKIAANGDATEKVEEKPTNGDVKKEDEVKEVE